MYSSSFLVLLVLIGAVSTEVGMMNAMMPSECIYTNSDSSPIFYTDQPGLDWEYFKLSATTKVEFEPDGLGRAELVIYVSIFSTRILTSGRLIQQPSAYHTPSVLNAKRGDIDVYMTSDLMEEHPMKPGYWKIYGRSDDQIMHSSGEKVSILID